MQLRGDRGLCLFHLQACSQCLEQCVACRRPSDHYEGRKESRGNRFAIWDLGATPSRSDFWLFSYMTHLGLQGLPSKGYFPSDTPGLPLHGPVTEPKNLLADGAVHLPFLFQTWTCSPAGSQAVFILVTRTVPKLFLFQLDGEKFAYTHISLSPPPTYEECRVYRETCLTSRQKHIPTPRYT